MPPHSAHRPLADSTVLIVGCVRDCEHHLGAEVERLQAAFAGARAVRWLLIESDSSDGSVDTLDTLSHRHEALRFLSLGQLQAEVPIRTARIAHCRNAYVREIRENDAYRDVDYVVVADLDGANALITRSAIETCWTNQDWDVCTANQAGPYYDIWALRHDDWSPNDVWRQYAFINRYAPDKKANRRDILYSRMVTIPSDSEWIPVDSAFGGLGIYRKRAFHDAIYTGLTEQGLPICEHVPFHAALKSAGYRIAINPGLINSAYNEHNWNVRPRFRRLKGLAKAILRFVGLRKS